MIDSFNDFLTQQLGEFFNLFGEKETFTLFLALNREKVFEDFFKSEQGFNSYKLAFLDKNIKNSPYQIEVENYPERLTTAPSLAVSGAKAYPNIGELPEIDEQALNFLSLDIKEACICVGGTAGGPLQTRWLGRNALDKAQFWSTTKIIPILNVINYVDADIDGCAIADEENSYDFNKVVEDVITYQEEIGSSNALAAMFKCFQTYEGLEIWLKQITGNNHTEFQGLYGEEPFIASPTVKKDDEILLTVAEEIKQRETQTGENLVTAYDLTRIMSMVGWYYHLPEAAKFPGISWENLKPFISSLGKDTARYVDVALEKLGLQNSIKSPVIISKMGFGYTSSRRRTELTYTCFTQFEYRGSIKSVAMCLRGAISLGDFDKEAVEIDARMAAEVTEILRRLVMDELE